MTYILTVSVLVREFEVRARRLQYAIEGCQAIISGYGRSGAVVQDDRANSTKVTILSYLRKQYSLAPGLYKPPDTPLRAGGSKGKRRPTTMPAGFPDPAALAVVPFHRSIHRRSHGDKH